MSCRDQLANPRLTLSLQPPELISSFITQDGIQNTNAVAEEAIRMWF